MTSIYPTSCTPQVYIKNSNVTPKTRPECKSNPQALNTTLLALAIIGLSTLTSCSKDEYLGPNYEVVESMPNERTVSETSTTPSKNSVSLEVRTDSMLRTLGLLNDSTSLSDKKLFYSNDDTGVQHWIKMTGVYKNVIYGTGMSLLKDCSAGEIYSFRAENDKDNGINVLKQFNDGSRQNLNYVQQDDGSIAEYEIVGDGFKLEKSIYKKQDDGTIERTFSNGEKMIYSNMDKDYPYPTPITFDANI